MESLLENLKYTIPAVIVLLTAYFLLTKFFKNEENKRRYKLVLKNKSQTIPLRLQAYERMVLLLERISPESLLVRNSNPKISNQDLQSVLLADIRSEFEHNLAQQIYLSNESWTVTKGAKESIVKLINLSSSQVKPDGPSLELSKAILENYVKIETSPISVAIEFLKKEVRQFF